MGYQDSDLQGWAAPRKPKPTKPRQRDEWELFEYGGLGEKVLIVGIILLVATILGIVFTPEIWL